MYIGVDGFPEAGHAEGRAAAADRLRGQEYREEVPHGQRAHGAAVSARLYPLSVCVLNVLTPFACNFYRGYVVSPFGQDGFALLKASVILDSINSSYKNRMFKSDRSAAAAADEK